MSPDETVGGRGRRSARTGIIIATAVTLALSLSTVAAEGFAQRFDLKDGSTLFVQFDGIMRMVDLRDRPMVMRDGVEMELKDGRVVMMKNRRIWVRIGPPGKTLPGLGLQAK